MKKDLKYALAVLGVTPARFAEEIKISRQALSQIMLGQTFPSDNTKMRIFFQIELYKASEIRRLEDKISQIADLEVKDG